MLYILVGQVCQNTGYVRVFGGIDLAVLSGLGRRSRDLCRCEVPSLLSDCQCRAGPRAVTLADN